MPPADGRNAQRKMSAEADVHFAAILLGQNRIYDLEGLNNG